MEKYKNKKYKIFLKLKDIFSEKTRVFNFKRTKWLFLKKIAAKKFNFFKKTKRYKKFPYYMQEGVHIPTRWQNLRVIYKESVIAKKRLYYFYLFKTRLFALKKKLLKSKILETFLLDIEHRIDIILWRSNFFSSPAVARFYIQHKHVYINHETMYLPSKLLREGDLISFSKNAEKIIFVFCSTMLKNIYEKKRKIYRNEVSFGFMVPFFLEINWNTLQIAVISKKKAIKIASLSYLYNTRLSLSYLNNYLRKL